MPNQEAQQAQETRAPRTRPGAKPAAEAGVRVDKPQMTPIGRIGLIISGFLGGGVLGAWLYRQVGYDALLAPAPMQIVLSELSSCMPRANGRQGDQGRQARRDLGLVQTSG